MNIYSFSLFFITGTHCKAKHRRTLLPLNILFYQQWFLPLEKWRQGQGFEWTACWKKNVMTTVFKVIDCNGKIALVLWWCQSVGDHLPENMLVATLPNTWIEGLSSNISYGRGNHLKINICANMQVFAIIIIPSCLHSIRKNISAEKAHFQVTGWRAIEEKTENERFTVARSHCC